MERSTWTDGRLDDHAGRIEARFDQVDAELLELRREIREQGVELRNEMRGQSVTLGGRIDAQGVELRGEIASLRLAMVRSGGGMVLGFVSVLAAVLAQG